MGPERFSNAELKGFHDKIECQRAALTDNLAKLRQQALLRPQDAGPGEVSDLSDLSSLEFDQDLSIEAVERVSRELREFESANAKLKSGQYGKCESCGQDIPASRLAVVPEARFCGECQTELEEDQRLRRHGLRRFS